MPSGGQQDNLFGMHSASSYISSTTVPSIILLNYPSLGLGTLLGVVRDLEYIVNNILVWSVQVDAIGDGGGIPTFLNA